MPFENISICMRTSWPPNHYVGNTKVNRKIILQRETGSQKLSRLEPYKTVATYKNLTECRP